MVVGVQRSRTVAPRTDRAWNPSLMLGMRPSAESPAALPGHERLRAIGKKLDAVAGLLPTDELVLPAALRAIAEHGDNDPLNFGLLQPIAKRD